MQGFSQIHTTSYILLPPNRPSFLVPSFLEEMMPPNNKLYQMLVGGQQEKMKKAAKKVR
jgi:hypothetical protein